MSLVSHSMTKLQPGGGNVYPKRIGMHKMVKWRWNERKAYGAGLERSFIRVGAGLWVLLVI